MVAHLPVFNNSKVLNFRLLLMLNNIKLLIISQLQAFTGVHGSEREHFGVLRAVEGV